MLDLSKLLKTDHDYFKQLLKQLEEQLDQCTSCDSANWTLIDHIVNTLCHYPDQKHHVIEDEALALLKSRHWISDLVIDSLHRDHERLHLLGLQAQAQLSPFRLPDGEVRLQLALNSVRAFIDAYNDHIRTEEELVFPMIKKLVADDTNGEWQRRVNESISQQSYH